MARGRRNDRTGPRMPPGPDSSDTQAVAVPGAPGMEPTGLPASYETVEYEEIAETGAPTEVPVMADEADRRRTARGTSR